MSSFGETFPCRLAIAYVDGDQFDQNENRETMINALSIASKSEKLCNGPRSNNYA